MDRYHDIFHLGIVNGAMRLGAPCVDGVVITAIDADDMDAFRIGKFMAARIAHSSTHDEVETLGWSCFFHSGFLGEDCD